jgi:predicted nucleic acid-binding protein
MKIIADTNIFLAVAMNEPEKAEIIERSTGCEIFAPEILPYEIGNALSAIVKRKQLTHIEAIDVLKIAQKIQYTLLRVDIRSSLELALRNNIYAYDAYFLQSALSYNYPLFTLDGRMKSIANKLGIALLE